ncbi:MAG: phosphotransferase [Patescibacteria group bacterium]
MPAEFFLKVKNKKYMRAFFEKIVKDFFPPGSRLKNIEIFDISEFEFKKSLKYELTFKTPAGKTDKKIFRGNVPSRDSQDEIKIADLSQKILYRKGFAFTPFHVPLSLGYYPKINLVLYEEYPGVTFSKYIRKKPKDLLYLTKQAALWLARFHELKIKQGKIRSLGLIKNEIGYFKEDYKNYYPGIYAAGTTILENSFPLFEELVYAKKDQFCLTHGDFNPHNIIINKNSIGVIDWGRSVIFDPVSDLANLIAQTNLIMWRGGFDSNTAVSVKKTFIDAYLGARNIKFKEIKARFQLHELWWIMQIIAYTVSVSQSPEADETILRALRKAREICRELNVNTGENISPWQKKKNLKEVFSNKEVMMKFYNKNLRRFFPAAKHIIDLTIDQPDALSETSFLTRTKITVATFKNEKVDYYLRGNIISHQTYIILKHVYEHNQPGLVSPRPLFFFRNVPYVFYEETPGTRLREWNFKSRNFSNIVQKIAATLARLHRLPWPAVNKRRYDEPNFFQDLRTKIKKYDAPDYPMIKKWRDQYLKLAKADLKGAKLVLSHNDFQASNIIITPANEVAVIDYTLSCLFYPAFDVANFLIHLRIMLDRLLVEKRIKTLQNIFLETYYKKAGLKIAKEVKKNLSLFKVRSALDIWTISTMLMGPKDKNRARYLIILKKIIQENLE